MGWPELRKQPEPVHDLKRQTMNAPILPPGDYDENPRDYAVWLCEEGHVTPEDLALGCLKYMSHAEVREMLDANEWSPRFIDG